MMIHPSSCQKKQNRAINIPIDIHQLEGQGDMAGEGGGGEKRGSWEKLTIRTGFIVTRLIAGLITALMRVMMPRKLLGQTLRVADLANCCRLGMLEKAGDGGMGRGVCESGLALIVQHW